MFVTLRAPAAERLVSLIGERDAVNAFYKADHVHDPMAISFEVKTSKGNRKEAENQLAIWVASHVARFELLLDASRLALLSEIVLPLVRIDQETWTLQLARVAPDLYNPQRVPRCRINIFDQLYLGASTTVQGTYRLLKSLRILQTWADTDFRLWFDRVLGVEQADTAV